MTRSSAVDQGLPTGRSNDVRQHTHASHLLFRNRLGTKVLVLDCNNQTPTFQYTLLLRHSSPSKYFFVSHDILLFDLEIVLPDFLHPSTPISSCLHRNTFENSNLKRCQPHHPLRCPCKRECRGLQLHSNISLTLS